MKKIFLLLSLFVAVNSYAQTKPKQKEKPPTQKELEDMMKEMQAEMDGMSAEDKKMLDSMGVKLPSTQSIPKLTDQQWKEAMEEESRIVPKRNATKIAAIPKPITDAKMGAYISAIQSNLANVLKPAVITTGNKAFTHIQSNSKNSHAAANMAIALWLKGQPELAVYVMSKICAADPANINNLSNFSSMLSMLGAQHLAIPILNNLNKRFPKNSTILNNLGQAWFGLGEIDKADKYLDSTIRIYAYHPQANQTKSLIEESKGNKKEAVEATKRSIAKAFTIDKENRLNKLGYKLKPEDINWDQPMPADPLGLEKFGWPAYPINVEESMLLEPAWQAFRDRCNEELAKLQADRRKLEKSAEEANMVRTKHIIQASQKGKMVEMLPTFAHKAMAKMGYLVNDKDGHLAFNYQKKAEAVALALKDAAAFEDILSNQLKVLEKKYEDEFGEGKRNPFQEACDDDTRAKNKFLAEANPLLRDAYQDFLRFMRRKINDEMYYYQYTMWPEMFELTKVNAKIQWLNLIKDQKPRFKDESPWCKYKEDDEEKEDGPFKLAKFDDVACRYNYTMDLYIMKIRSNCSRMTSELDLKFLQYTRFDDFERSEGDTYMNSTVKISVEKGLDDLKMENGPLKLEAKVGASVELEFDRSGLKDVTVGVEAKAGIGTNVLDPGLEKHGSIGGKDIIDTTKEAGVEGRISLISGHGHVGGTGALEKINILSW